MPSNANLELTMPRLFSLLLTAFLCGHAIAETRVKITPDLAEITVQHSGEPVTVRRNQDTSNEIDPSFQLTSRRCPPFCIQPFQVAEGVETIDELQMLEYLKRISEGDDSILVIDSRGSRWLEHGTIPGSINIHYKKLSLRSATESDIAAILEHQFGVERNGELWNYRWAKTLVLFCNGMWCGQAPTNIRSLLRFGYPASKLKWYRGGVQDWETLGLTSIKPDGLNHDTQ